MTRVAGDLPAELMGARVVRAADGHVWVEKPIPLRWHDADMLGHVNHTLYLSFMSEARDRVGVLGLGPRGMEEFVLVHMEIDWVAEATLDDHELTARSRLLSIGTSSLRTYDEVVRPDGEVAARAETVLVATDRETVTSRPFTADERAALERLL